MALEKGTLSHEFSAIRVVEEHVTWEQAVLADGPSVAGDTKELLPVCAWCTGEYGISDVYVGVPVRLGRNGVEEIVELALSDEELEQLRAAAEGIRAKCADLASL